MRSLSHGATGATVSNIDAMNRRELGFLLIGLGIGLMIAVAEVIEFAFWLRHIFIVETKFGLGSLVLLLPFLLIFAGAILVKRNSSQAN